jgi:2-desacetyl-2-hydroxyethyl bacteriochlorophyllide A dehydrogenase
MSRSEISIVIRTYNEEQHLPALLDSLNEQSVRDFEVVVVDSGSLDRTRDIAAQGAHTLLRMEKHDFTFGHSLNVGVDGASGRYIAIASAHTLPADQNWLANLVDPLREQRTAMVYGRQVGGDSSKFGEIQDMRRTFGLERRTLRLPDYFANNANSAIRKDLWQEHPFDESLLGLEDIEWARYWMKRHYDVVYEPRALLYHFHDETWRQVRRRYYREAVAARRIGVQGFRDAVLTPPLEAARVFLDLGAILTRSNQETKAPRRLGDLVLETICFRANKAAGTIRGLLHRGVLESPSQREEILFDRACKAVVIDRAGHASLEEIEIPKVKPGEVLIRVAYEAVCATDIEIFDGSLGYYKNGMAKYPIIPGHEFSGHIVTSGSNVRHVQPGEPVVVECIQSCGHCDECERENWIACESRTEMGVIGRNGGYAEYVVVPGRFVHRLPADCDMRKACLCEPLAVVLKGIERLKRASRSEGDPAPCAVVGAGPLGHLCAKVLSLKGHRVAVFDRNPVRRGYLSGSKIDVFDDLHRLGEFDTLVEVTGDPEALDLVLHQSPAGATILLLGLPYAHRKFTFESIVAFDKTVVGSVGSTARNFEEAVELLGRIETDVYLERILPLSFFREAWDLVRTQDYLKVLLEVRS